MPKPSEHVDKGPSVFHKCSNARVPVRQVWRFFSSVSIIGFKQRLGTMSAKNNFGGVGGSSFEGFQACLGRTGKSPLEGGSVSYPDTVLMVNWLPAYSRLPEYCQEEVVLLVFSKVSGCLYWKLGPKKSSFGAVSH